MILSQWEKMASAWPMAEVIIGNEILLMKW